MFYEHYSKQEAQILVTIILQSHAFIITKLCATDSSISPGLINKVDSIYISARGYSLIWAI